MEIALTICSGVVQLALVVLGVYVSLKPPQVNRHKRYIAAFIVLGLFGIGFTVVQQTRNSQGQARVENDLLAIRKSTDTSRHARFYFDNPQELRVSPLRPFRKGKIPQVNVVFINAGPGSIQNEL